ncbi:MAG: serine/threonine-protein kinase [Kofleriaceae bacterium]
MRGAPPFTDSGSELDVENGSTQIELASPDEPTRHDRGAQALAAGEAIGRFRVERHLGAGGMGQVYAAHDPELDRTVAVKVLHDTGGSSSRDRARFLREARAMARLRHSNVVTVHDVGEDDRRPYIAMELVDGPTLAGWLRAAPRSWREIRAKFVAAGRGLAAAHEAGMIHRDFKPSNVMCRNDGGVVVLDFGLAVHADDRAELAAGAPGSGSALVEHVALTRTGALVGTPSYMAPEQLAAGARATASSDQWSFCVALYEALYGELPFAGKTSSQLASAMIEGVHPPSGSPRFIARLLRRGLALDPDRRYPSMTALLAELERDPGRRARWTLGATAGVLVVASIAWLAWPASTPPPCRDARLHLDGVWDTPTRTALRAAFVATGKSFAGDTYARVAARLDGYADAWVAGHGEACEAGQVRGEQSAELLDRRMQCLDGLRDQLDGLVKAMTRNLDARALLRTVSASDGLGDVADCADTRALRAGPPRPGDPAQRASVARLDLRLDEEAARGRLGDPVHAAAAVGDLMPQIQAVPYRPLHARALFVWGHLLAMADHPEQSVAHLDEAVHIAEELGDNRLAANIWVIRVQALANQQGFGDTDRLMLAAESAVRRIGSPPDLVGELEYARAAAELHRNHHDEADRLLRDALTHFVRPDQGLARGRIYAVLGQLAADKQDARALAESSRKLVDEAAHSVGPNHMMAADGHQQLGTALMLQGDHAASERELLESVRIYREIYGPDAIEAAQSMMVVAVNRDRAGTLDTALAAIDEAIAIFAKAQRPTKKLANALEERGSILQLLGRSGDARSMFLRVLDIRREILGDSHPAIATSYGTLGGLLLDEHDATGAIAMFDKAVSIFAGAHLDGPRMAGALVDLAEAQVAANRGRDALHTLDRVAPHLAGADDTLRTRLQLVHGTARWSTGDHAAGLAEVRAAQDTCGPRTTVAHDVCTKIAGWLKTATR